MKRVSAVVAVLLLALSAGLADEIVTVYVDGKQVDFRPAARVRAGTAYAPLRATAESLGAEVKWNAAAQMASVCRSTLCVAVRKSDGITVDNQMLVPLRLLGEALGAQVAWDGGRRAVVIKSP